MSPTSVRRRTGASRRANDINGGACIKKGMGSNSRRDRSISRMTKAWRGRHGGACAQRKRRRRMLGLALRASTPYFRLKAFVWILHVFVKG